jgi:hypothetical protein
MKTKLKTLRKGIYLLAVLIAIASCSKEDNEAGKGNNFIVNQVANFPKEPLNADELTSLPFMREEEKLARDVYTFLYAKWGVNIFSNISSSEQTHTDAVLHLLTKYNIPDPADKKAPGVFTNPVLRSLYIQLTAQGSAGLLNAFVTGATIEDLDIYDLKNALTKIDNQDISFVYESLMKGSRNHLRSFYNNILGAGGSYTPQYITQAEFDAIISSPMETGY